MTPTWRELLDDARLMARAVGLDEIPPAAGERSPLDRAAVAPVPRRPIAEDADSLGGSLPVDVIARRQDRRQ